MKVWVLSKMTAQGYSKVLGVFVERADAEAAGMAVCQDTETKETWVELHDLVVGDLAPCYNGGVERERALKMEAAEREGRIPFWCNQMLTVRDVTERTVLVEYFDGREYKTMRLEACADSQEQRDD